MKKVYFLALFLTTLVTFGSSCSKESSARRVAERVLTDVGNGIYRGHSIGDMYFNDMLKYDSPDIEDYEIQNHLAFCFKEYNEVKDDSKNTLLRLYFNTDGDLFDDIKYLNCKKGTKDLYHVHFPSLYSSSLIDEYMGGQEAFLKECNDRLERYKNELGFQARGYDYIYIQHPETLMYTFFFKLDRISLAKVKVACVKGEKPKVVSIEID